MQCSKQCSESKVIVLCLKQMRGSCFCNQGRPSTTGYWPSVVTKNSKILVCAPRAKEIRTVTVYVMAPEETDLPLATVRSCGCCNRENFNPCSCANKELINDAVAPQSAIAKVLNVNEVSLRAIVHGKTMWLHYFFVLATSALADINNPNLVGPQEQLCSRTACFPKCCSTMLLYSTIRPLSFHGYQCQGY